MNISIHGGDSPRDSNNHYKCVTENWMKVNHVDRVKEWWPMKNNTSLVKLEDDAVLTIKI